MLRHTATLLIFFQIMFCMHQAHAHALVPKGYASKVRAMQKKTIQKRVQRGEKLLREGKYDDAIHEANLGLSVGGPIAHVSSCHLILANAYEEKGQYGVAAEHWSWLEDNATDPFDKKTYAKAKKDANKKDKAFFFFPRS